MTEEAKRDRSVSTAWANVVGIGLFVPVVGFPALLWNLIWDSSLLIAVYDLLVNYPLYVFAGFPVLIVIHEMLHGLTWRWLSKVKRSDIRYGFQWKTLTPYVHLKVPIRINPYRWGTAMPGLVLGVLPSIVGLMFQLDAMFLVGLFMTAAAGGDMLILFLLRKEKATVLIEDHPSRAGCYVLDNPDTRAIL